MRTYVLAIWGLLAVACQSRREERRPLASTNEVISEADSLSFSTVPRPQPSVASSRLGQGVAQGLRYAQARASSVYLGKRVGIDYRSHALARRYRTILTAGYQEGGVNFGGHYRLVTWMCGSSCTQSALVDARTGSVYEGPVAALGFSFRAGSRLLIVNPPDSGGVASPLFPPGYWVWHEAQRRFERS